MVAPLVGLLAPIAGTAARVAGQAFTRRGAMARATAEMLTEEEKQLEREDLGTMELPTDIKEEEEIFKRLSSKILNFRPLLSTRIAVCDTIKHFSIICVSNSQQFNASFCDRQ